MKYSLQKRISAFVLAFALVMTTAFNSIGATTKADAAAKVKTLYLTKKTTSLVEGETGTAQWAVRATKATKALAAVKVTTSDSSVVKITKTTQSKKAGKTAKAAKKNKGTVKFTAVSAGTATIKIVTKKKTKKTKSFKVTVTAKSTEAPATQATTQASADATTGAVATTEAPASANASADSKLKGVTLSTTTPKVGDVIKVILDPVDASDVKSYTWYEDNVEVSGNATNSYTVTSAAVGKIIKAVVTNNAGTKFDSNSTAAVIVDNSKSVKIKDLSGFQSDGTAYVSDTLSLVFGDSFGLPQAVTWYVNGSLVKSIDKSAAAIDSDSMSYVGKVTGNCYAMVTALDGTVHKSDVVSIVDVPCAAKMSDVKLTEDYTNPANIEISDTSTKFVFSVTLNKDYAGTFRYIPISEKTVTTTTAKVAGAVATNTTVNTANIAVKKDSKDMTESAVITGYDFNGTPNNKNDDVHVFKRALGENASGDCPVQYMFVAPRLTRGTDYKLVFDQDGVDSDNIGDSDNKTANLSDAVTANYVKAPTTIKVTDLQTADDEAGWTATLYNGDSVCKYINDDVNTNAKIELKANTSTDTKGGSVFATKIAKVTEGKGDSDPAGLCAGPGGNSYVYAVFTGKKGIFGKDDLVLTSAAQRTAIAIASKATVSESTTKPKNVDVKVENLASTANVYLVTGKAYYTQTLNHATKAPVLYHSTTSTALTAEQAAAYAGTGYTSAGAGVFDEDYTLLAAQKAFDASNKDTYKAVASMNAGMSSASFVDVLDKVSDKTNGDVYGVVIVPVEASGFANYNSVIANSLILTQNETSYKLAATDDTLHSAVDTPAASTVKMDILDQFGEKIATTTKVRANRVMKGIDLNSTTANLYINITGDGTLWAGFYDTTNTDYSDNNTTTASVGDKWSFSISETQTLWVTVKSVNNSNIVTGLTFEIK